VEVKTLQVYIRIREPAVRGYSILRATTQQADVEQARRSTRIDTGAPRNETDARGTDIYTSDSPISIAAVHAGILKPGESGPVIVHVIEGQSHYEGSTRNGVTTRSYGSYGLSYMLEPAR